MKGNVIQMNTLHLNSVRLNGIGKVQSVSLKGGSTEGPVFPPVEPPVEPTPTYTFSASVTNGKVSAKRNGSAVNLPFTANEGDVIIVEVTPNDGYAFEGWNDGNTDNPRSITMTADVVLSAQCVEVVQPPVGNYIQFEDPAVEAICVANWSSDGIGLTEEDAAAVTTIGTIFKGNTEITSFNELRYFTNVTSIPTNAFDACSNLRSIGVNWDKMTSIGANAFRNCSSLQLEEVALPNLTNLGSAAFHGILALKRVTDLGFVPSVQLKTFYNTGLLFINFPATITSIGSQVFRYVTTLEQVIVRATTPPSLDSLAFQNTNDTFIIYVPDASLEAYKTATNWSAYADRIHPLSEIERDDSRLDYIHDSMFMWLDGIDKGSVEGEWQDLVGNNNFVNHGAIELANGYQFNGDSYMTIVLESSPLQWSDDTTLEVVVEFAGNSAYDVVLVSGYQNGVAFGRTQSQLIVASNNERPAYADPLAGYAAGKAVVAVNKNTALYNGSPLATQGTNYFGEIERTQLGVWIKTNSYFKGKIHAIRIHDRILSEEEILYNQRIDNKRFNLGLDI